MSGTPDQHSIWERIGRELASLNADAATRPVRSEALAERLQRRARQLRGANVESQSAEESLTVLAFVAGRERYAIPIESVTEVQPLEQFSPVPGAPPFVRGVVQHRGSLLALLEVGRLFGLPEEGLADVQFYAVVQGAGRRVAVAIRELHDIIPIPHSALKDGGALRPDVPTEWVQGVHDDNRVVLRMESLLSDPRLTDWREASGAA